MRRTGGESFRGMQQDTDGTFVGLLFFYNVDALCS